MLSDEQKRTIWRNLHPLQGYGTDADLFALALESAVRAQCEAECEERHQQWELTCAMERGELQKRADANAKDAARYRWLRDDTDRGMWRDFENVGLEHFDEAIDAAISEQK